jgi:hypothetical protein
VRTSYAPALRPRGPAAGGRRGGGGTRAGAGAPRPPERRLCDPLGVVDHFHVDPAAHDESTLTALAGIFDAVVRVSADGLEVRTTTGVGVDEGAGDAA